MKAVVMMPAPSYSHNCPSLVFQVLRWALNDTQLLDLGGDPGVFQTLGSCGSFLWQQFQHSPEERTKLGGFLPWPLIFIQQDFKQAPWFQLRDVAQLS